jgi:hypothetical protein
MTGLRSLHVAIAVGLALTSPAFGDAERFEPETSVWSATHDGETAVYRTVFADTFAADVRVRMLSSGGSPGPHYDDAIALAGANGAYRIVAMHTDIVLALHTDWGRHTFGPPDNPVDYRAIRPQRCEMPVSPWAAWAIMETSRLALLQLRYAEGRNADHITRYRLWMLPVRGWQRELAGKIANPSADSVPGIVTGIGEALHEFCMRRDPKVLQNLGADIAALVARLNAH